MTFPFYIEVDRVYHLACPASPPHYQKNPIKTIKCSTLGCLNMLGLAKRCKARLLFTSTSEIYGDPLVHPQPESYWGNVHTWGKRACYDEGKRIGETMCYAYREEGHCEVRVARIFNTYGPRMDPYDGRVVSNFIMQALRGEKLTVYGSGGQTRSFQFVGDLVRGLISLMEGSYSDPVNMGNPQERTIAEFAELIAAECKSAAGVQYLPKPEDDPMVRRPLIDLARKELGWQPVVPLQEGLKPTIEYFSRYLGLIETPRDSPIWLAYPLALPSKDSPDPVMEARVVDTAPVSSTPGAEAAAAASH